MTFDVDERGRFRAALRKGQGRALQAVRAAGRLIDEDAMLDACLHNCVYDPQVEGSRGPWLLEILDAAGVAGAFEAPILAAMASPESDWDAEQYCDFAEALARRGSQAARSALYRLLETAPFRKSPEIGDKQIVRLDGVEGLLFVAGCYGAALRRGEDRDIYCFADLAADTLGADIVTDALADTAPGNPDIRAFNEALAEIRREIERGQAVGASRAERLKSISPQELFDAIDRRSDDRHLAAGWGRTAAEDQLHAAAERLFVESDLAKLYDYLRIFWRRPYPEIVPYLIRMFDHLDEKLRRGARNALAQNSHPAVRALALARMSAGRPDDGGMRLLVRNYEPGDHLLIEKLLPADDGDEWKLHHLCSDLVDVFRENGPADCAGAMSFVYERTPCSACRYDAVKLLLAAGAVTPALIDECRYDSDPDTRDLVAGL